MYKALAKIGTGRVSDIESNKGVQYTTYAGYDDKDSPMDILAVALAGCKAFCVRGYFKKIKQDTEITSQVSVNLDINENKCLVDIKLSKQIDDTTKEQLITYVKNNCTVAKTLRQDIEYIFNIQ